mmetsp:Transcript_8973/g.8516  ORF Transcript_8973/g.8516 Transcript_8973/m.8516 type:complete len:216 (-) Transcript_8973:8-655(-)
MAGIVLAIEKESLKILTQNGNVQNIDVNDVSNKVIQKNNVSTLDHDGNFVSVGDPVRVVEGPNKNLKAIIRNIHQNSIFLYNKEFLETFGYFVENNKNIAMRGEESGKRNMTAPNNKRRDPLIGKIVTICKGEYKGFEARVVDTIERTVKLELFFKSKIIQLRKSDIIEKDKIQEDKRPVKMEPRHVVPKTPAYQPNSPGYSYNNSGKESPNGGL